MTGPWNHLLCAAYKISYSLQEIEQGDEETAIVDDDQMLEKLEGGELPITPKLQHTISRLEEQSKINLPIFFPHDVEDGQPTTKLLLERIALQENDPPFKELGVAMVRALDKRVTDGLLLMVVSEDREDIVGRRLILWYLPQGEGGFQFTKQNSGYILDEIADIYIDSSSRFKAAVFEGSLGGKIADGLVSQNARSGSRYWIERFLGASFMLESQQIQHKLAQSLKSMTVIPAVKEFNQRNDDGLNMVEDEGEIVFDFMSTYDEIQHLDDSEEMTIVKFAEEYVPEPQRPRFTSKFPEEIRDLPFEAKVTKQTFQEQFKRKKIRAILPDNSVIEIIGSKEIIEKHLKRESANGRVKFTLEASETIEDYMR